MKKTRVTRVFTTTKARSPEMAILPQTEVFPPQIKVPDGQPIVNRFIATAYNQPNKPIDYGSLCET